MCRAKTSFPVPLSPVMRTIGTPAAANFPHFSFSLWTSFVFPTISGWVRSELIFRRYATSSFSFPLSRMRRDDDLHLVQVERLRQVVRGADLHRLDGGLRRVVRGQHDHLGGNPLPDDLPEDVDAVPPRELDVQQHDVGGECPDPVEDALGVALRADVVPVPAQRPLQHGDDQLVVVQQEDLSLGLHAAAPTSALTGSRMVNSTPPPGRFATAIVPSCRSIICREIARPRPVPFGLVVKNG